MRVRIDGEEHEFDIIEKKSDTLTPSLIGVGIGLIIVLVVMFKFGFVSL